MSDRCVALIDATASHTDAVRAAPTIVACLADAGLIVPTLSADCVLGGNGYPAGPRCAEQFNVAAGRGRGAGGGDGFWELVTSGVEVHVEPWVNLLGFAQVEHASCPRCGRELGEQFVDAVSGQVDTFLEDWHLPQIACPACGAESSFHEWRTEPLLGFVHLAVVCWNWPPFDDPRWRVDVVRMLHEHTGRTFATTFGRL